MNRPQAARIGAIVTLAAAGLLWMNNLAPLQWPSVLAYSGIAVFLCGALSVLVPRSWSGLSRRVYGLLFGIGAGAMLFTAGMVWPARTFSTPSPVTRLDAFMPTYNFCERHEALVHAPAERVRHTLHHVAFTDIGVIQALGRIRAAAMGQVQPKVAAPNLSIVEMIKRPRSGFFPLDDSPGEFVFGLAGQPWNNRGVRLTPEEFRRWAPPGNVKICANFLIEDAGNGRSRVITETRVAANDDSARRKMARYWALIYPGSGMIRRSLLKAVQERAESGRP